MQLGMEVAPEFLELTISAFLDLGFQEVMGAWEPRAS